MSQALQKKIRAAEEEHAEEFLQNHLQNFTQAERDKAFAALGAIGAVNKLSNILSAETMRALMQLQEQKVHEALGYQRFDDFLNDSEYSPMTKHQFYERKKVLESEGDILFNSLNDAGLAISKRKLLGRGNIKLDSANETVIVSDPATGEETSIELKDKSRLLETLTAIVDSSAELRKKVESQSEKLNKADDTILNLQSENERILAYKKAEFTDFHADALLNLVASFKALEHQADQLTDAEKSTFAPKTFETIAELMNGLSRAYGRNISLDVKRTRKSEKQDGKAFVAAIAAVENDEDLASLMD